MTGIHRHASGIVRREFLQVGFSGFLGLGLPGLLASRAKAGPGSAVPRAKSMILVFLTGGLGHLDSFDMKPEAPEGIRGEFKPIATSAPGVHYCEHLPGLASHADKAGDRPVDVPHLHESPERHPRVAHGALSAGGLFRQDRFEG